MRRAAAVALGLLLASAALPKAALAGDEVPVGGTLRDATLAGLNGPAQKLSAYRGRPLLINVWASWCGPCRQEMQSLERLAWRSPKQRFAIIGISTDDYPEKARALLDATHATISQFIDAGLQMETMLGATHLPLTVFIDADGRVLRRVYGAREWDSDDSLRLIEQSFALR